MISVMMEKECGCFKKSNLEAKQTFQTKEQAHKEAEALCEEMNETFCQKHHFTIEDQGDTLLIKVAFNN
jgi:hypothetical protein